MRAVMSLNPNREIEIVKIFVNGVTVDEPWNNFRSLSRALDFLSENYGILVGINFFMDEISIRRIEEKQYSVRFI